MSRIQHSIVVAHRHVAVDLLNGIQHDTYQDEQRCSSEELCKTLLDPNQAGEGGEDGNQGDEERPGKREVGHDIVDIVGRVLTRLDAICTGFIVMAV